MVFADFEADAILGLDESWCWESDFSVNSFLNFCIDHEILEIFNDASTNIGGYGVFCVGWQLVLVCGFICFRCDTIDGVDHGG